MLAPGSKITQEEQDALVALLDDCMGKASAVAAAEANLDQYWADRLTTDVGMMFDLYGDGELKPALDCVRLGGRRPASVSARIAEQKRMGTHPPAEPPPAATAGVRAQAVALYDNRQRAREEYNEAGQALNSRLNHLMYRDGCSSDSCCDVFGDGLIKRIADCHWPAGVQLFKGRLM